MTVMNTQQAHRRSRRSLCALLIALPAFCGCSANPGAAPNHETPQRSSAQEASRLVDLTGWLVASDGGYQIRGCDMKTSQPVSDQSGGEVEAIYRALSGDSKSVAVRVRAERPDSGPIVVRSIQRASPVTDLCAETWRVGELRGGGPDGAWSLRLQPDEVWFSDHVEGFEATFPEPALERSGASRNYRAKVNLGIIHRVHVLIDRQRCVDRTTNDVYELTARVRVDNRWYPPGCATEPIPKTNTEP